MEGSSHGRVLGLFAKQPLAGQVKTRLAAATSPAWAAVVAAAFLLDMLDELASFPARRLLSFAPRHAGDYFKAAAAGRFEVFPQSEGDLGRRIAEFFAAAFEFGARRVVLLGTDSPSLPVAYVENAFAALEDADLVLGPATDGGYYLVGCRDRVPPIFDDIRWGSAHVLADTLWHLADGSSRLAMLPPWYDIDTLDDWHMLVGHLDALRRAGQCPTAPRTVQLAQEHFRARTATIRGRCRIE